MLNVAQNVLLYTIPFLAVLTLVVTVHELGHFLVGRMFGVAVKRFSVGFGRALLSRYDKSGTEWRLGWIPVGGYVMWAEEDNVASVPDEEDLAQLRERILAKEGPAGLERYFHFKPLWQRALVTVAGPAANFVLAILIFSVWAFAFGDVRIAPRIGNVLPASAAMQAGFQVGDVVVRADGQAINSYEDMLKYAALRPGQAIRFEVDRNGRHIELTATPSRIASGSAAGLGNLGVDPVMEPRVAKVVDDSPAMRAGFRPDDVVVSINGAKIGGFNELTRYVVAHPGATVLFGVQRAGRLLDLRATLDRRTAADQRPGSPAVGIGQGRLGVESSTDSASANVVRFGPIGALREGFRKTGDILGTTFSYLGQVLSGHASGNQFSGIVGIAGVTGQVAADSTREAPSFSIGAGRLVLGMINLAAFISVAVGFANLLPIPVLDGGHLLFYGYEAVARRPLAANVQAAGYRVGFALLISLMLFVTWNDLQRFRVLHFIGGLFS